MSNSSAQSSGIGLSGAFLVLFVALKLTGHIDWAWGWVLAPLWLPVTVLLGLVGLFFIAAGVWWPFRAVIDAVQGRRKMRRDIEAASVAQHERLTRRGQR